MTPLFLLFFLYVLFLLPLFAVHLSTFFFIPPHFFCYRFFHTPLLTHLFLFLPSRPPPPEIFFLCLSMTACRSDNFLFFLLAHVFCHPLTHRAEHAPCCLTVCYPSLSIPIRRHISLFFHIHRRLVWIADMPFGILFLDLTYTQTQPFPLLSCLFDIYFFSISLSARRFSTTVLSYVLAFSRHHSPRYRFRYNLMKTYFYRKDLPPFSPPRIDASMRSS